jgi:hypothetical protein
MERIVKGQKVVYDGRKVDSYDKPMERLFRILGRQNMKIKKGDKELWKLKIK